MRIDYRELKRRIRLRDLLTSIGWTSTEGRGEQLRGPCPLPGCRSRRSSGDQHAAERDLSIHVTKNVYRCFHCGSAGNALDFWKTYRSMTPHQAAVELHQFLEKPQPYFQPKPATKSSTLFLPPSENG